MELISSTNILGGDIKATHEDLTDWHAYFRTYFPLEAYNGTFLETIYSHRNKRYSVTFVKINDLHKLLLFFNLPSHSMFTSKQKAYELLERKKEEALTLGVEESKIATYITLLYSVTISNRGLNRIEFNQQQVVEYLQATNDLDLIIWAIDNGIPVDALSDYANVPQEWLDLL